MALPSPVTCWGQCLCKYPRVNKAMVTETSRNMGHAPQVAFGPSESEGPPKTPTLDTQCVPRPDPASKSQARRPRYSLGIHPEKTYGETLKPGSSVTRSDRKGHIVEDSMTGNVQRRPVQTQGVLPTEEVRAQSAHVPSARVTLVPSGMSHCNLVD